ncbi:MAG: glycosyltransferase family 2 protein [Caldilineaceae bacterium]|nr:glycosyltransferase family 2 protein [Caldilineaceae bacterium]
MSLFLSVLQVALWAFGMLLALMVSYLVMLTVAAWGAPRHFGRLPATARHRFAFLVPAHNEELLLPKTLANLSALDYPKALYDVYVVADNCTDQTAMLARAQGAFVYERFNSVEVGKGYALQWLLQCIVESGRPFDAAVIVDADSVVSNNFLQVMDAHLQQGAKVVQCYDGVLHPDRSWAVSLRAAAMAVLNYVRPQGRMVLGGSAGLKGNGMVFHREILEQYAWSASVTEDIEYHMTLILQGIRVRFAPDTVVLAEMPETLANSHTQNVRWEQGRLEMARHYIPKLLRAAIRPRTTSGRHSSLLFLDALMELFVPPFAVLMALSLLFAVGALWLGTAALWLAGYILLGQVLYLLTGLLLTKAPAKVYLAFLYIPMFMLWKLWLYVRVFFKIEEQGWVRAVRDSTEDVKA